MNQLKKYNKAFFKFKKSMAELEIEKALNFLGIFDPAIRKSMLNDRDCIELVISKYSGVK